MVVYVEYIFLDTLIVSYLCLKVCSQITKTYATKKVILLASAVLSTILLVLLVLHFSLFQSAFVMLLATFLTSFIVVKSYKIKSSFLLFYFIFVSLLLVVFALSYLVCCLFDLSIIELYSKFDILLSVVLLAVYTYLKILLRYFSRLKNHTNNGFLYDFVAVFRGKTIKGVAFLDSGNSLVDSTYNLPVVVVPLSFAEKFLSSEELISILYHSKCESIESLHYISYSTASHKNAKMPALRFDGLKLQRNGEEKNVDCVVGISFNAITKMGDYEMLLNMKIFESG